MKTINRFIVLTILLLQTYSLCYSYSNEDVHPFAITGKAVEVLETDYASIDNYFYGNKFPYGYMNSNGSFNRDKIQKQGTLGTIRADELGRFPLDQTITLYHFYNPVTHKGGPGIGTGIYDNAIKYGQSQWNAALWYYVHNSSAKAHYNLGLVLHLLQDMCVDAHVYNDSHISKDFVDFFHIRLITLLCKYQV